MRRGFHFRDRRHSRGQSLVEFTLVVPVIMMMALTIAEFGVAFGTNMTLIEATREGARVGAVLSNGSGNNGLPGCTGAANVDPQIILAVQRVVESPGSGPLPHALLLASASVQFWPLKMALA